MAALSFKSVGDLSTDRQFKRQVSEIPIGIKTPMRLGQSSDGIFSMHTSVTDQIRDNFRNMILTNHGERWMLYDFGADLRALTMELSSDQFDLEAMSRIKKTSAKYMPFLDLQSFEKTIDRSSNQTLAQVKMRIRYSVPALQVADQVVEVKFFIVG